MAPRCPASPLCTPPLPCMLQLPWSARSFPTIVIPSQDSKPWRELPFSSSSAIGNAQVNFKSQSTLFPPLPGHPEETQLFPLLCSPCTLSTNLFRCQKSLYVCLSTRQTVERQTRLSYLFIHLTLFGRCSINIYRTKEQVDQALPILILL